MIRFNNVTKDFGGETLALDDVSFEIQDGEFVFLTGHSGSGKSTLLKIITKEYLPTSGDVEFNDVLLSKIRGGKVHKHRRLIGVVFQDYRLLPELNIWENIALPLEITGKRTAEIEERVTDLLELVQLTDKAHVFPSQLSGGESQRVGIARALATAPAVLLADEPTGNLDPQNTMIIAKLFNKINEQGTTIIFATHDPAILSSLPHRRMNLANGKVSDDTKSSLKSANTITEKKKPTSPVVNRTEPIDEITIDEVETDPDLVITEVENLDDTPLGEVDVKTEQTSKKKGLRITFPNPFRRRTSQSNSTKNKELDEGNDVVEELNIEVDDANELTDFVASNFPESDDLSDTNVEIEIENLDKIKSSKKAVKNHGGKK